MDSTQNDKTASANYAVNGKITLSSVLVLFSVIAAVIFMHAYSRCRRHRLRRRSHLSSTTGTSKHGLNPSLLAALPTFPHSDDFSGDPPECAVCLAEFEAGDELRALPRCHHAFHAACIDAWLGSHSNCPLCRSPVAPPPPEPAEVRIAVPELREEPVRFPEERCERKTRLDLAGLAEAGLCSTERNQVRVKCSMKRIWSI